MFSLENRNALVIGGGRGIGAAITRALVGKGAKVTVFEAEETLSATNHYQSRFLGGYTAAKPLTDELGIELVNVDACSERALTAEIASRATFDVLVNSIGSTLVAETKDTETDQFRSIMETNLVAPFVACREIVRRLLKEERPGAILNISSISGKMAFPWIPAYCAAKSGLIGFTGSLALEVAGERIHVNSLSPGIVQTGMWKYLQDRIREDGENNEDFWTRILNEMVPQNRSQPPEAMAHMAVAILENDFVTGQSFSVDGGMNRHG